MTRPVFEYDGSLWLQGELECSYCAIGELDPDELSWRRIEIEAQGGPIPYRLLTAGDTLLVYEDNLDLNRLRRLDLQNPEAGWTTYEVPKSIFGDGGFLDLFWTGNRFLAWRHHDVPPVLYDNSSGVSFHDGALFDPETGEWEEIPAAAPPSEFVYGEEDWRQQLPGIWTDSGLFVWGLDQPGGAPMVAVYEEGADWERLAQGEVVPPERVEHHLLTTDGYVYMFSGSQPRGGGVQENEQVRYGDLWRYSLEKQKWAQVTVPEYVDLYGAEGTVLDDGRLVFAGRVCAGVSIYDPKTDTWARSALHNAPRYSSDSSIPRLVAVGEDVYQSAELDPILFQLRL